MADTCSSPPKTGEIQTKNLTKLTKERHKSNKTQTHIKQQSNKNIG